MEELPSKVSSQQSQLHFSVNHAKLSIWFNHEEATYSIYNVNGMVFTITVVLCLLLFTCAMYFDFVVHEARRNQGCSNSIPLSRRYA